MFSSITSYLFGFGSEDAQADSAPSGPDEALTAIETDGDWMLVEKNDKLSSSSEDEDKSDSVVARQQYALVARRMRNQRQRRAQSNGGLAGAIRAPSIAAASSIAALYSLSGAPASVGLFDGSWYITPPPCFTAGGPGAAIFSVAASPLENLLIEHPSMSVYENIDAEGVGSAALVLGGGSGTTGVTMPKKQRRGGRGARRDVRDPYGQAAASRGSMKTGTPLVVTVAPTEDNNLVDELPTTTSNSSSGGGSGGSHLLMDSSILANLDLTRYHEVNALRKSLRANKPPTQLQLLASQLEAGQKVQQWQQVKLLHRKQLERFNKTQEFESIGKRQRRKDFMRSPSGKSNNRKY